MESGGWQIELLDTGMVPVEARYMGPTFTETYEGPVPEQAAPARARRRRSSPRSRV
jgi:hypothetical protein